MRWLWLYRCARKGDAVSTTDPTDGKPGLRLETAAGVLATDMMAKHIAAFQFVIKKDRHASQTTVAAYIEGLAAVVALTVAGGHGSRDEVVNATVDRLREEVDRVLSLRPQRQ